MKILLGIAALAVAAGLLLTSPKAGAATVTTENIPRGIRNNNPTNLEYRSIGWRGETGSDGRYSVFDTAINGLRAAMINLHTMFTRDNLNTVRQIIERWAPDHENPTEHYINFVASRIEQNSETELDWHTYVIPLTRAIVLFENGINPYTDNDYFLAKELTGR